MSESQHEQPQREEHWCNQYMCEQSQCEQPQCERPQCAQPQCKQPTVSSEHSIICFLWVGNTSFFKFLKEIFIYNRRRYFTRI